MAEFQEVMRQIVRLCEATPCSEDCPLESECMNLAQAAEPIHAERIERIVMKWAAEHPEHPVVYPTWYEWLTMMGVVTSNGYLWIDLQQHIPADIAQKLGIEPKWESKKRPSE